MKKFTHQAPIVPIKLEEHPNADSLSIVKMPDSISTVVVRTSDWENISQAVWIQPQSIVDTDKAEFSFLYKEGERECRIKPIKLRGVHSMGLLIPVPPSCSYLNIGDDCSDILNVKHWEPELDLTTGGDFANGGIYHSISKYDVDSIVKHKRNFITGELISVTEKLHGTNTRIYYDGEKFLIGTRNHWIKEHPNSVHYRGFLSINSETLEWLKEHPNYILYGETVGDVKGYRYGLTGNDRYFYAFDIRLPNLTYMSYVEFKKITNQLNTRVVPELSIESFSGNFNDLAHYASGLSTISNANHIREGCVIKPYNQDRIEIRGGRVIGKIINPDYK